MSEVKERKFEIGDRIICMTTGVVGQCLEFYMPTNCKEQTMVLTDDGRRYHAPTEEWEVTAKINPRGYEGEEGVDNELFNPYGECVISVTETCEHPTAEAILAFFQQMGY